MMRLRDLIVLATAMTAALVVLPAVSGGAAGPRPAPDPLRTEMTPCERAGAWRTLSSLPVVFEPVSPDHENAEFVARGPGYLLAIDHGDVTLAFPARSAADITGNSPPRHDRAGAATRGAPGSSPGAETVRMTLAGARARQRGIGEAALAGRSNYFTGTDSAKWRANVPMFQRVRYDGIYPGIDLVYYGNPLQLEYDFLLAPGADPRSIALTLEGARSVSVGGNGDTVLALDGGEIRLLKPVAYQEVDGVRREVACRYTLARGRGRGRYGVGFEVGDYDRGRPLVIDPVLGYSTYIGGGGLDHTFALAIDRAGAAYITGYSAAIPVTPGAYDQTPNGWDAYVVKLDTTKSGPDSLVWATYLGGSLSDQGNGIAVDGAGDVYVMGRNDGGYFPVTAGAFDTTYNGGLFDLFVAKLSSTGSALLYATYLGGDSDELPGGIAVDASGNAYVAGLSRSSNYPTTPEAYKAYLTGTADAVLTVLNGTGSTLLYSTYFGGTGAADTGKGVAVDASGGIYLAGVTDSADLPATPGALDTVLSGTADAFVAKLDPSESGLNSLVWSAYLGGGGGQDAARGVAVGLDGQPVVFGLTDSSDFPATPDAFQGTYRGTGDAFIAKVAADGSSLVYATYLGGTSADDFGSGGVALDPAGKIYVTGETSSTNFPTTPDAWRTSRNGTVGGDMFVSVIDPSVPGAGGLVYSTYIGGTDGEIGTGIAADACGNITVGGWGVSTDFPMLGAFQGTFGGGRDCIVARFNATGTGPGADLTVSNSAPPGPLLSGDPLTYTVTVANEGPDPATGVRLTVPLPGGVAFQSATAGCALDSGAVSCPLGTIGSGSSSVITIDATAQAPSTVTTVATASATSFDPDCSDNTGAATTRIVAPVLAVLDPNGGETVPSGGSYPIVWSAPAGAATFDLAYSMNDGSSWAPIASGLTGRTFPWSTPRPRANAPRSLVRIKAYDAAHSAMGTDFSDGPFTVEVVKLLAPNGLEVMSPGEVRVISWRTNGTAKPIAKVVLKYTTNEGKKWIPITKFIGSNPGSYAWTVPAVSTAKTRCKVRVVLKDAKNTKLALDDSDALFTINP